MNDDSLERYLVGFDVDVDDDAPTQIFGIPENRIKAAVMIVEGDVPGSFHGYVNGMPESQWRPAYCEDQSL